MIAAQAMRCLSDLLTYRRQGSGQRQYAFSAAGETQLGFSQASLALGMDVPPVAEAIRSRVDAFLASSPFANQSRREAGLLSILALLDMMTSNDARRLVLAGRDTPSLAAYCASHNLAFRLFPEGDSEDSPALDIEHTLIAMDVSPGDLAGYARSQQAVKGIIIASASDFEAKRYLRSQFPVPADEIATGVDLGTGATVAWLWPRL